MTTTTWNGEWKPTLPFTAKQRKRLFFFGIAVLKIDGREIKCGIYGYPKKPTIAQSIDGNKWFQLTA